MITITRDQLSEIITQAVNLALARANTRKEWISKAEADKRYGRKSVDRWIRERKINAAR